MKKMIQAGLIVSSLASVVTADIFHTVSLSKDGTLDLMVRSPYTNIKSIFVQDFSPNKILKTGFEIDFEYASNGEYHIKLRHKETLPICQDLNTEEITGAIFLAVGDADSDASETEHITYRPCYEETPPVYHFETEHPYANNTHTVKVLPALCGDGETCIDAVGYARIVGETEKNYDFVTVYQNGQMLGRLDGVIDGDYEISNSLPTEIHFDSDYSVTKSGVTIDLHY